MPQVENEYFAEVPWSEWDLELLERFSEDFLIKLLKSDTFGVTEDNVVEDCLRNFASQFHYFPRADVNLSLPSRVVDFRLIDDYPRLYTSENGQVKDIQGRRYDYAQNNLCYVLEMGDIYQDHETFRSLEILLSRIRQDSHFSAFIEGINPYPPDPETPGRFDVFLAIEPFKDSEGTKTVETVTPAMMVTLRKNEMQVRGFIK